MTLFTNDVVSLNFYNVILLYRINVYCNCESCTAVCQLCTFNRFCFSLLLMEQQMTKFSRTITPFKWHRVITPYYSTSQHSLTFYSRHFHTKPVTSYIKRLNPLRCTIRIKQRHYSVIGNFRCQTV